MTRAADERTGHVIRRAFVRVDGRTVHCRIIGDGPPALFIHSSPTNGSFVVPDMLAQADRHTCFAFDTPGFGLSDPLRVTPLAVGDLADATAAAMRAIGLPPLPVFGTHSGAAIALELGRRHPALTTGLVLDGVPIFTPDEVESLGAGYFAGLAIDRLGGHYAANWTRFRDQSRWFPWCDPRPEHLNDYDLATPAATHRWTQMFYAAAADYAPAYRAVTSYGDGAVAAARTLRVPAIFTALDTDMVYPHLRRLPPLRAGQEIVGIGPDPARKHAVTRDGFARFGSPGAAPALDTRVAGSDTIRRQFVMDEGRAQMIRTLGDRDHPPVLLLHDVPGSGAMIEAAMTALAGDRFVILPDLPGSGESDPLGEGAALSAYARAMWRLCDALAIGRITLRASGLATSLAVAIAAQAPGRCAGIEIDGLFLPDAEARASMQHRYAPPITIEPDGAHWYRLWLRLRDSLIYWPWYDTGRSALRRVPADLDGARLHLWTVEVMKQYDSHHRLIDAILAHDVTAAWAGIAAAVTWLPPASPVGHAHAGRMPPR